MKLTAPNLHLWGFLAVLTIVLIVLSSQLGRALIVRPLGAQSMTPTRETTPNTSGPSMAFSTEVDRFIADTRSQATALRTPLHDFSFDVVTVDSTGRATEEHLGLAQYYTEDVGATAKLDMVKIPEGTFMMGVSFAEAEGVAAEERRPSSNNIRLDHFGNESVAMQVPQRPVSVQSFFMGRFEVTQAQWRSVARLSRVAKDIVMDPAFFKGDDLPVEEVTWEDAIEFCARLSRATGRVYRLPSEAEWEYACRAGTTTQFSFGETVTTELVNYNGDYPYGLAPKGQRRGQTVRVGSVGGPNAFGLYDMHGNVKEWCMDPWHENYNGAPWDGRVWNTAGGSSWSGCGADYRVVRGGSWLQGPCSSARRSRLWWSGNKNYFTGFRVVCSAAG